MKYRLFKETDGYKVQVYEATSLDALANMIAFVAVLYYKNDRQVPRFYIEEVHDE